MMEYVMFALVYIALFDIIRGCLLELNLAITNMVIRNRNRKDNIERKSNIAEIGKPMIDEEACNNARDNARQCVEAKPFYIFRHMYLCKIVEWGNS